MWKIRLRERAEKTYDGAVLFLQWGLETCAFILLPLFVYVIVFFGLEGSAVRVFRLPEWMFAAIILHADVVRKLLRLYRNYRGFHLKMLRTLSFGILGIVISSIFLVLSIIAQERPELLRVPAKLFYGAQMVAFGAALYMSAAISMWIGSRNNEALLLRKMIPDEASANRPEEV